MADSHQASIPAAVRRQARRAEKAHKQAYSPPPDPATPPEGVPAPAPTAASADVVQLASAGAPEAPQGSPAPVGDPTTGGAPSGAPPEPPAPAEPPVSAPPAEDWEHKYRTLQGMIDREVGEKRDLQRQLDSLQTTVAAMTSVAGATPEQPAPGGQRRLKTEDIDTYGEDIIKVMRDAAHDEFMPVISKLQEENSKLKAELGGVTQQAAATEAQQTEAMLTREVPNWREINTSAEFLEWLGQPDPFSGQQRHKLLQEAGANGPRVLAFFKAYLNESNAIRGHQEAAPPAPKPNGQGTGSGPIVDPTSLVAPGRPASQNAGAGAAAGSEEPQFFTQRQIATFYREVQQGKWKNRPKEKDKRERAIHKAATEGRVRA